MSTTTSFLRVVVSIPLLAMLATGQVVSSRWADITMIAPGTQVRVATASSKSIQGTLESATESALVIKQKTGTQSCQQAEVVSVSIKKKGHRVRNTFIGLGVGAAVGVGVGVGATNGCSELLCGIAIAGIAGAGVIAGTVTGLVWRTGGWREVYAR